MCLHFLQCPSNTATIPGTVGATSINECYFYINNLSPNNQSTFGNKPTTFFGTGFDVDATYIIKTNENEWASVTAVSETEITAISPSLLQVTTAPPEEILCKYSQVGSSGITREIDFFVGNQKSNRGSYSYDFDKGEISGIVSL